MKIGFKIVKESLNDTIVILKGKLNEDVSGSNVETIFKIVNKISKSNNVRFKWAGTIEGENTIEVNFDDYTLFISKFNEGTKKLYVYKNDIIVFSTTIDESTLSKVINELKNIQDIKKNEIQKSKEQLRSEFLNSLNDF